MLVSSEKNRQADLWRRCCQL